MREIDLMKYLEDCVQNKIEPVQFELIQDSQTKQILAFVAQKKSAIIVDYGCGNMRLYNALIKNKIEFEKYIGIDIEIPEIMSTIKDDRVEFCLANNFKNLSNCAVDLIVCCNVLHELQIIDILYLFETSRHILKESGYLLLVDMTVLPDGELEAVPFIKHDFFDYYCDFKDISYTTKSGIPVLMLFIGKDKIPDYFQNSKKILEMFIHKRNSYSEFAMYYCKFPETPNYEEIINRIGIQKTTEKKFVLGYLMYLAGAANVKIMNYAKHSRNLEDTVLNGKFNKKYFDQLCTDQIFTELIILSEIYVQGYKQYLRVNDVFNELRKYYSYEYIKWGIQNAVHYHKYFFQIDGNNSELQQTDAVTDFLNENPNIETYVYEKIKNMPPVANGRLFILDS